MICIRCTVKYEHNAKCNIIKYNLVLTSLTFSYEARTMQGTIQKKKRINILSFGTLTYKYEHKEEWCVA